MAGAKQPPTQPVATGGNDGDGEDRQDFAATVAKMAASAEAMARDRKAFVLDENFMFSPASLVGSWFHRLENDVMVWQGVVVAEPQPGVYLVQIDRLDHGAENVQRLVRIDQLVSDDDGYDWRFYDSENDARSAYARWVAAGRERV